MKPAIKRTVNKSVDRTQRNKEKEKGCINIENFIFRVRGVFGWS